LWSSRFAPGGALSRRLREGSSYMLSKGVERTKVLFKRFDIREKTLMVFGELRRFSAYVLELLGLNERN